MKATTDSISPLREHASAVIRIAPYLAILALTLFFLTLRFMPRSPTFQFTAAAAGAVSFAFLWLHWRRPHGLFFGVLVLLVVFSSRVAQQALFPADSGVTYWPSFLQFSSIYFFVQLLLVFVFRHRLRESLNNQSNVA